MPEVKEHEEQVKEKKAEESKPDEEKKDEEPKPDEEKKDEEPKPDEEKKGEESKPVEEKKGEESKPVEEKKDEGPKPAKENKASQNENSQPKYTQEKIEALKKHAEKSLKEYKKSKEILSDKIKSSDCMERIMLCTGEFVKKCGYESSEHYDYLLRSQFKKIKNTSSQSGKNKCIDSIKNYLKPLDIEIDFLKYYVFRFFEEIGLVEGIYDKSYKPKCKNYISDDVYKNMYSAVTNIINKYSESNKEGDILDYCSGYDSLVTMFVRIYDSYISKESGLNEGDEKVSENPNSQPKYTQEKIEELKEHAENSLKEYEESIKLLSSKVPECKDYIMSCVKKWMDVKESINYGMILKKIFSAIDNDELDQTKKDKSVDSIKTYLELLNIEIDFLKYYVFRFLGEELKIGGIYNKSYELKSDLVNNNGYESGYKGFRNAYKTLTSRSITVNADNVKKSQEDFKEGSLAVIFAGIYDAYEKEKGSKENNEDDEKVSENPNSQPTYTQEEIEALKKHAKNSLEEYKESIKLLSDKVPECKDYIMSCVDKFVGQWANGTVDYKMALGNRFRTIANSGINQNEKNKSVDLINEYLESLDTAIDFLEYYVFRFLDEELEIGGIYNGSYEPKCKKYVNDDDYNYGCDDFYDACNELKKNSDAVNADNVKKSQGGFREYDLAVIFAGIYDTYKKGKGSKEDNEDDEKIILDEDMENSSNSEDAENSSNSEDAENSSNSEDAENSPDSKAAEDSPDSEDAENSPNPEDAENSPNPEDAENSPNSKDAENSPDSKDAENSPNPEDAENSPDSKDAENSPNSGDAEDSPDSEDAENSPNSKDAENSPNSEDAENSPDSEDAENSPNPEDAENSPNPEVVEGLPNSKAAEDSSNPEDAENSPNPEDVEGSPDSEVVEGSSGSEDKEILKEKAEKSYDERNKAEATGKEKNVQTLLKEFTSEVERVKIEAEGENVINIYSRGGVENCLKKFVLNSRDKSSFFSKSNAYAKKMIKLLRVSSKISHSGKEICKSSDAKLKKNILEETKKRKIELKKKLKATVNSKSNPAEVLYKESKTMVKFFDEYFKDRKKVAKHEKSKEALKAIGKWNSVLKDIKAFNKEIFKLNKSLEDLEKKYSNKKVGKGVPMFADKKLNEILRGIMAETAYRITVEFYVFVSSYFGKIIGYSSLDVDNKHIESLLKK